MDICEFLKGETIISDGSVSSKSTTDFVGQRGRKYKKVSTIWNNERVEDGLSNEIFYLLDKKNLQIM